MRLTKEEKNFRDALEELGLKRSKARDIASKGPHHQLIDFTVGNSLEFEVEDDEVSLKLSIETWEYDPGDHKTYHNDSDRFDPDIKLSDLVPLVRKALKARIKAGETKGEVAA